MANIPVSTAIDNLLKSTPSTTVTTAQALTALGAVTTGGALGTPTSGTLTNATDLPIVAGTSGTLTVARGGTGTSSPAIVAGTNVTVSGTWPNQTVNAASGGTPADGSITAVKLATSTYADQADTRDALDVTDTTRGVLPYTMAKIMATKGVNDKPFRVSQVAFGDSYVVDLSAELGRQVAALKGVGMGNSNQNSGGAPVYTSADFTRSINGLHWPLSAAGHANQFPAATAYQCFKVNVFYTIEVGAGAFSVAANTSGAGFVDIPTATAASPINTATGAVSGTIGCGVFSYEFATSAPRLIKATWQSGGTVRILGITLSDVWEYGNGTASSQAKGGTEFFDLAASGQTVQSMSACPQAVFDTILQTLKPQFATFKADDNAGQMEYLQTFMDKCLTAWPSMDFVLVSSHPQNSTGGSTANTLTDADKVMRRIANTNGSTFINMRKIMPTHAKMLALGYGQDLNTHLTATGNTFQAAQIMEILRPVLQPAHKITGQYNVSIETLPQYAQNGVEIYAADNTKVFGSVKSTGSGANPGTDWGIYTDADRSLNLHLGGENYSRWVWNQYGGLFGSAGTDGFGATKPSRYPTGHLELHTGNSTSSIPLVVSCRAGQTANMLEVRTGSSASAAGSVATAFGPAGALITVPVAQTATTAAVNVDSPTTSLTTTAPLQGITLANGVAGQIKIITHVATTGGGTAELIPATKTGYAKITFTNLADSVTLQYYAVLGWVIISIKGAVAA